jgi:hypothetical protein
LIRLWKFFCTRGQNRSYDYHFNDAILNHPFDFASQSLSILTKQSKSKSYEFHPSTTNFAKSINSGGVF